MVAGWDLAKGGANKADKSANDFYGKIICTKEPGVIDAMLDKELVLDAGVWLVRVQCYG